MHRVKKFQLSDVSIDSKISLRCRHAPNPVTTETENTELGIPRLYPSSVHAYELLIQSV